MNRFLKVFRNKCSIIGMIHVDALPGTPKYQGNFKSIVEKAKNEASIYQKSNIDAILIENMHDIPYIQDNDIGPEIVASMTALALEIKHVLTKKLPVGIQILACGNKQALAVAKATDCQFIRNEGFVFSHIADEGFTNSNAGTLLRYRKNIDADNILVFTDIKKKHSSHAITSDVSLIETAHAAEFFSSDGVIITGTSTGHAASKTDLVELYGKIHTPIIIGSGVTLDNLTDYFYKSNAIIIGSYFKESGLWSGDLSGEKIGRLMDRVFLLRDKCKNSK